jgi:hypothetical protein
MISTMLRIPRATFSVEEPWAIPDTCETVPLVCATDGSRPRLATFIAAYWDRQQLTVVFSGADDHVRATHYEHDAPLYEEDVVELFLAPSRIEEYFELEVNPLGTTFDARIESPDGIRPTMKTDLAWTCEGFFAAVRRTDASLDVVLRIPFASFGRSAPEDGETWRANFYRIDRHPRGDEFTAWRPTMKSPPDFHVAAAFGTLRFEARAW